MNCRQRGQRQMTGWTYRHRIDGNRRVGAAAGVGYLRPQKSLLLMRQAPSAITAYSPAMTGNRQEVLSRNRTCAGAKSTGAQGKTSSDWHCCDWHPYNPRPREGEWGGPVAFSLNRVLSPNRAPRVQPR
jgi:hypothetical protein